ncbi:hypothetical protein SARC_05556 [Sphaeroforma arctica JP610]|uniref:Uncharacterized protein n=1 Tax=Sphaeroforma arctica JP610 TaxID=667725 RepID=A0A0L0FZY2_9EUKA|nr:hypothetical protein SARC_05556 [Sphaeroforma arctica JP610]KNC82154.1 hypothetical protein SARC_05556 [Sphaeroforma arctica JP610]|eukprot:XP_014156056.1 hypothetical protein SARC_05556 [Sphaeroforma arctica JP610]
MNSKAAIVVLVAASAQAMSTRQANTTTGVPYIENAAFVCENSNQAQCVELVFCEWMDYSINPDCFENEDLVERINDIACYSATEATCATDVRCEWDDNKCQGQHGAVSVVSDSDGKIMLDTTGITAPPAGSMYVEVETFCTTILDKTTCEANQYCEFDDDLLGDSTCKGDDDNAEDTNDIVCAPLTPKLCLADLRCELDDNVCEGGDSIGIAPAPSTTLVSTTPVSSIPVTTTAATTTSIPAASSTDAVATTTEAVVPGTPTLVVPEVICEAYTNQTICNAVVFCEWDGGRCEADDDTVKLINDASCVNLTTEAACDANITCDWDDTYCEGSDDAILVITNVDGSISAVMTGVTVPANGTYQNADKYCAMNYIDEVACGTDKYCKWYNGMLGADDRCEADDSLIEAENTPLCAAMTLTSCAADLRCEYDDEKCEAVDDMIIV